MSTTHYRSCPLCEATCGVAIEVDGDRVVSVRGDDADPFSKGYICPKGAALADLHHDPDRLRTPMRRTGETWSPFGWDEALDLVMPGVVSVPHGWGHNRTGAQLRVAAAVPGASVNDVIDSSRIDELSGTSALSGQPVEVTSA